MYLDSMLFRALIFLFASCQFVAAASPLESDAKVVVIVFVSSECPISNKFAPELERLSRKYSTNGISFNLVYPNASDTDEKIAKHRREFQLTGNFARDPKHELVKAAGVTITPEAAVFNDKREIVYRGRVNDQYVALGKGRPKATKHDLEEAVDALLAGKKPNSAGFEAVGCYIQDLEVRGQ